ncbi:hypothetical protein [Streptococcus hyointestinalis]|uniref:hypothetical protein n=1 Tax=Streptococcus hyointestinalis TaxID=1337 RepID=UPI0013E0B16C|nr:hypothetical protein [Streptococcus hyointestinalis]
MKPQKYPYSGQRKKPISNEIDSKKLTEAILEANHDTVSANEATDIVLNTIDSCVFTRLEEKGTTATVPMEIMKNLLKRAGWLKPSERLSLKWHFANSKDKLEIYKILAELPNDMF